MVRSAELADGAMRPGKFTGETKHCPDTLAGGGENWQLTAGTLSFSHSSR